MYICTEYFICDVLLCHLLLLVIIKLSSNLRSLGKKEDKKILMFNVFFIFISVGVSKIFWLLVVLFLDFLVYDLLHFQMKQHFVLDLSYFVLNLFGCEFDQKGFIEVTQILIYQKVPVFKRLPLELINNIIVCSITLNNIIIFIILVSITIMFGNVTSGSSFIKEHNYYFWKKHPYSISTALVCFSLMFKTG